jgi:hypothetical protein
LLDGFDGRTPSEQTWRNTKQDEKRYNGWTNYETWVTALWLDNDYATQFHWREATRESKAFAPSAQQVKEGYWTIEEAARFTLAETNQLPALPLRRIEIRSGHFPQSVHNATNSSR